MRNQYSCIIAVNPMLVGHLNSFHSFMMYPNKLIKVGELFAKGSAICEHYIFLRNKSVNKYHFLSSMKSYVTATFLPKIDQYWNIII